MGEEERSEGGEKETGGCMIELLKGRQGKRRRLVVCVCV